MSALRNPVLLLTWGIPLAAVLASFLTLGIALSGTDTPLPEDYHWEGMRLDRDFERARRAAELDVRATLQVLAAEGLCRIELRLAGRPPEALDLALVHGTLPALDQRVRLLPAGAQRYEAPCRAPPAGPWRIGLADAGGLWSVRVSTSGALAAVAVSARPTEPAAP